MINEEFVDFVLYMGYRHRVGFYFIFDEIDGYINVSCNEKLKTCLNPPKDLYSFSKNFYFYFPQTKDIHKYFDTLEDLKEFMCKYHKQKGREYKLSKLLEYN